MGGVFDFGKHMGTRTKLKRSERTVTGVQVETSSLACNQWMILYSS
jgi:hypothetical protein